jgi:polyribonucleotide 5'-hydroxyl-kinase
LDLGSRTSPGSPMNERLPTSSPILLQSMQEGLLQAQITPLVYFYGHTSPADNPKLYTSLVSTLASRVAGRLDCDPESRSSGLIINTCGWTDSAGYEVLLHCMAAFNVNVVLVMGHDKLYAKLISDTTDNVTVVKLPKSGGIVERVHLCIYLNAILSDCRC